jgi:hypothetical protein
MHLIILYRRNLRQIYSTIRGLAIVKKKKKKKKSPFPKPQLLSQIQGKQIATWGVPTGLYYTELMLLPQLDV